MAFQFQSVAALSPLISETYGVGLADIGLLIGLYLAPGAVVAIPGGAIAAWMGDKRIIILAMVLMFAGGLIGSFGPGWNWVVAGRLLAGAGGVIINVIMTKMVVDWFAGREISTAMAIFINSWPVGIALALLTLPVIAAISGLDMAFIAVLAVIVVGLVLFVPVYSAPEGAAPVSAAGIKVTALPYYGLVLAGLIWALYNTALAMVFSFSPALLDQRGWDLAAASSVTSIFMVVFSFSVPLGGYLADKTGRRDLVIMISFIAYAVLIPLVPFAPGWAVFASFVALGALFGFAAGPIMTLPSAVLVPETRAFGMGVFYTIYYVIMMVAPGIAGALADVSGSVAMAFFFGVGAIVVCMIALWLFRGAGTGHPREN